MAFVDVEKFGKEGKCYEHEDGTYLGKYKGPGPGEPYTEGPAAARNQLRTVFIFENKTLLDDYPQHKVKEVPCRTGGKRRTRKHKRKHKKTQKRRR